MAAIHRRDFLGTTAAAASLLATGLSAAEQTEKKRRTVRVAVMGVNGRGKRLIDYFSKFPSVEFAYICDVDDKTIAPAVKLVTDTGRPAPKTGRDIRVALDDKSVDVLVCSAPNHWHSLATIWACQAGKDVYVEKPVSHDIAEGRKMVEAARKYQRVVQSGTQRRSEAATQQAVELVRSGRIGKVHMARTWINSTRPNIGHKPVVDPPANLDFNMWCGPAPMNGYKENLVHYNWHWRWDYGGGECANNGIHALDIARWGMGIEYPTMVTCGGDKYSFDDDQETPDTQIATMDSPQGAITWEHRTWSRRGIEDSNWGIAFYGSDATLVCLNNSWTIYQGSKLIEKSQPVKENGEVRLIAHMANFLDCIESREKPNADVEIGHRSANLCHLANIALRTRSTVRYDGQSEQILDNPEATAIIGRETRKEFHVPDVV
mgnify:FL=1